MDIVNVNSTTTDVGLSEGTDEMVFGYRPRDLTIVHSLLAVFGFFGVLGNIMNIIVWTRPQMKSSSAVLLTALAASDLLILLCLNTLQFLGTLIFEYQTRALIYIDKYIWPYLIFCLFPVGFIAQTASVYLTLVITFERYSAVCHPFEFQAMRTYSWACKSAAAAIILSILYNLSRFWEREVRPEFDLHGNVISYRYDPTKLFQDPLYETLYMNWLYLFFNNLLPLAGIVILNTAICRQLKSAERERQTLTDFQKTENRLTMMLLYVVAEFFVCTSVTAFFAIVYIIIDISGNHLGEDLMKQLIPVDEFLYTFNSSANFVTYITFGRPFRRTFVDMFRCRRGSSQGSPEREIFKNQKPNLDNSDTV